MGRLFFRLVPSERNRALRSLGVRIGAFSLYMPALLRPEARALAQAILARAAGGWRPPADQLSRLPAATPPARVLAAYGLRAVRGLAVPVEQLERLDEALRAHPAEGGGALLTDTAREALGWTPAEAETVLRGLGFAPARRATASAPTAWRRRAPRRAEKAPAAPHSPFAALAALQAVPPPPVAAPKRRARRRRKARSAS